MIKLVALNELDRRIGEAHGRAKLSDDDVRLILALLDERQALIAQCRILRATRTQIDRTLADAQLSYRHIALKFEISKSQVRHIDKGARRCQVAVRFKRVEVRALDAGVPPAQCAAA